jgi:hypothetical protein
MQCEIQWIDPMGNPTPDTNEAIGRVRTIDRVVQIDGRGVKVTGSQWFNICACHATRLNGAGMHIWQFEAF